MFLTFSHNYTKKPRAAYFLKKLSSLSKLYIFHNPWKKAKLQSLVHC